MRLSDDCSATAVSLAPAWSGRLILASMVFLLAGWAQVQAADAVPAAPADAVAQAPATPPTGDQPKFRCDEPTYNFPDTWAGEKIPHTYTIHNDGKAVLKILQVRPTCGCTVAEFDKEIAPGKTGHIKSVLTTSKGMHSEMTKTIEVHTNDPNAAKTILYLKGKVRSRIQIDPIGGAQFGRVDLSSDAPLTRVVKVTNNTTAPLRLTPVNPDQKTDPFSVEIKTVKEGEVYELTVIAQKPFRDGSNFVQLAYNTGIAEEPQITVSANLFAPPLMEVMPQVITLATPLQAETQRDITLRYNAEGNMKVLSAAVTNEAIKATLSTQAEGKAYKVQVVIPQGFDAPAGDATQVVIKTDLKDREEIKVPIRTYPQPVQAEALVGKPAPKVPVKLLDGKEVTLGDTDGKVTVLDFWTSWCPHCKKQLPIIQKIAQDYQSKGVQFLLVSQDQVNTKVEKITDTAKQLNVSLPIAWDSTLTSGRKYGATGYPVLFLLGKNGVIEALHRGSRISEEDIRAQLDQLLAGKTRQDFPPTLARNTPPPPTPPVKPTEQPTGPEEPTLVVESMEVKLGAQKPGTTVKHNLKIRNGGKQALKLTDVTGSEGLKATANPQELAPNDSGVVTCEFTVPDKPGSAFEHQVTLASNDPSKPKVTVKLDGTVKPYLELDPPTGVDFSRRPAVHTMPRLATIIYNGQAPLEYLKAESNSPKFEATVKPIRQGPNGMVVVNAKPPFEVGEHKATITVVTNCPQQKTVEVPVHLTMPPALEVVPAVVSVPPLSRLQEATVSITNNTMNSLNILGVKTSTMKIRTQFYPEPDGLSYKLKLTLLPNFSSSPDGEKVTIRTDSDEFGEIVIPIKVTGQATGENAGKISRLP